MYACSEMVDHTPMLRQFFAHFAFLSFGLAGLEEFGSVFTHLKNKKTITEMFSVRHFLAIQRALEKQELRNVFWLPGSGNPADGLTRTKNGAAPPLRLL